MRTGFMFIILSFFASTTFGQRNEQLWLDYQVDYPFGGRYLLEAIGSYQTLLTNDGKWRSISVTPTFEYQGFWRMDLWVEMPMAYTLQTEDVNSFELNPNVGVRLNITPNKKVDTRFLVKAEQRMFRQVEQDDWDTSNRLRLKGEIWISINGPNLYTDKLWYGLIDYEGFIVTDQQLEERYANKWRARIGMGYRLNYRDRFELIYTRQASRNMLEEEYLSGDNVIQVRYKMFLNPTKPTK
jgi:hypothetical protein